jgi:hypothetical protein
VVRSHFVADAVRMRDVGEFHGGFGRQRPGSQRWAVYKRETACL